MSVRLSAIGWIVAGLCYVPLATGLGANKASCTFNDSICGDPDCTPQLSDLRNKMCRMDNTTLPPTCCSGNCAIFNCVPASDPQCNQNVVFWLYSGELASGANCNAPPPGSGCRDTDYDCEP